MKKILTTSLFMIQFFLFTSTIYAYQVDIYGENWDMQDVYNTRSTGGEWKPVTTDFFIKAGTGMKATYFDQIAGWNNEVGYFLYDNINDGITHRETLVASTLDPALQSGDAWEFTATKDVYLGFYLTNELGETYY